MVTLPEAFSPVVQQSTPGLIAEQLREGIMSGQLLAGAQLSEAELAKAFGVSRGPVREAMQRLLQEGLLRSERNRGIFVMELSHDDIDDIYDARTAIESAAVRMIVARETADLSSLHRACADISAAAASGDRRSVSAADLAFHAALVRTSNSPRLVRMHATLLAETRMCITALEDTQGTSETVVDEHRRILEALESGSLELALRRLEDHMRDGVSRLLTGDRPGTAGS